MKVSEAPAVDWTDRLLRLELRNQRLWGVVVLLLLVTLVQTVWHLLPGPPVVFAKRFVLQDGQQPPRGEFSLWADGTPALRINNRRGEALALWALRQDGTLSLRMSDSAFNTRVEMLVDPAGQPQIALYSKEGHRRANLFIDAANHARLEGLQGP